MSGATRIPQSATPVRRTAPELHKTAEARARALTEPKSEKTSEVLATTSLAPASALRERAASTTTAVDAFEVRRAADVAGSLSPAPGLPAIPARRLPALRAALADPAVPPMRFSSVDVPEQVMSALRAAKRILVVGHIPPDGDCVGSAAGLAAALRATGKDAIAVVDDALPSACRAIDAHKSVRRAAAAEGPFDLVVLVDVAQRDRLGRASDALAQAQHVLVVDHHQDTPTREGFALRPDQTLTTWVDPHADAAAVLVGGIAARLGEASLAASQQMLAASIYTDTLGFRAPGTDRQSLQLFKGVVGSEAALDALEAALRPRLPPEAAEIAAAVPAQITPHGAAILVDAATWQALGAAARRADPDMTDGDLRGVLCDRLDEQRDIHGVACMVIEEPGGVRISARSLHDGTAARIATALGGGGHGRSAGGFVQRPFDELAVELSRAMTTAGLAQTARLRSGRL